MKYFVTALAVKKQQILEIMLLPIAVRVTTITVIILIMVIMPVIQARLISLKVIKWDGTSS